MLQMGLSMFWKGLNIIIMTFFVSGRLVEDQEFADDTNLYLQKNAQILNSLQTLLLMSHLQLKFLFIGSIQPRGKPH